MDNPKSLNLTCPSLSLTQANIREAGRSGGLYLQEYIVWLNVPVRICIGMTATDTCELTYG